MHFISRILSFCSFLYFTSSCDLGPSDVFFVVKADHRMKSDVFAGVKDFMRMFVGELDIGRAPGNVRVGVILFDNIRQSEISIDFSAFGRASDLKTSISNLHQIACGSWCKERSNSSAEILDFAIDKFPSHPKRMKKIVLISDATSMDEEYLYIQKKNKNNINLQILQVVLMENKIQRDDPYYRYYYAYNDPYKRYVQRMAQLYPNYTFPAASEPVPPKYSNQIQAGRISVGEVSALLSLSDDVCNGIFACPPCEATPTFETSIDTQPVTVNTKTTSAVSSPTTNSTGDDYEYEITADPPGLVINNSPAKDKRSNQSINEGKNREKRRRQKRNTRKQSECSCESSASFSSDSLVATVDSAAAPYGSAPSAYSSAPLSYGPASYQLGSSPFSPYFPCASRPCRSQYPCYGSSCSRYISSCHNCRPTVPFGYGSTYSNPCSGDRCNAPSSGSGCSQPPCASAQPVAEVVDFSTETAFSPAETGKKTRVDDNGTIGKKEEKKIIDNYRFKKDSGTFGIRRIAAESPLLVDELRPSIAIPNIKLAENKEDLEMVNPVLRDLLNVKAPDGGSRLVSLISNNGQWRQ